MRTNLLRNSHGSTCSISARGVVPRMHASRESGTGAALCRSTYGDNPWTYVRPDQPGRLGKDHLASLDRATLVPFRWDEGKKQEKAGGSAKR